MGRTGYGRNTRTGKPGGGMFGFTQNQMRAQLANLGAKPTGSQRRVAYDQTYALEKFGGSQAGTIRKSFVEARATAQQVGVTVQAGKEQLAAGAKTLKDIAGVFKDAKSSQAAAYAYAQAQQFQEQTNASDEAAAEVARAAYEHKLAMDDWKMQQQYTAKLAAQTASAQGQSAAMGIATDLPLVSSIVKKAIEDNRADGGTVDWEAVSTTVGESGLDENQGVAASVMLQSLQFGTAGTMDEAIALTSDKLFSQYPGYDQWGSQVVTTAASGYHAAVAGIKFHEAVNGGAVAQPVQGQPGQTAAQLGLTPVGGVARGGGGLYEAADGTKYRFDPMAQTYVRV